MKISDSRAIVKEYFNHAANIRQKKVIDKRHAEILVREIKEKNKVFKERLRSMIEHEEQNAAKKIARLKEADQRQAFLKPNSALNII